MRSDERVTRHWLSAVSRALRYYEHVLYAEEEITPRVPTRDEVALATDVAGRFDGALYLRVDMLPSATGPVISEVEAVEPSLFCHIDPVSANRFATAVRRRVG